ncbi:hypothetical protein [Natroniella sp. ANB-PHB2]|uniref:hypothetical protein n=1 Tax=Natroniella sp. ANB-PHB2 TaxID=3384444 RepID=UPI0038D4415B
MGIKDKVDELEEELSKLSERITENDFKLARHQEIISDNNDTLNKILDEMKKISSSVVELKTKDSLSKQENKLLTLLIVVLSIGFLFSIGVNVSEIMEVIP